MIDTSQLTDADNGREIIYQEMVNGKPRNQRGLLISKTQTHLFLEVRGGAKAGKRVSVAAQDAWFPVQ